MAGIAIAAIVAAIILIVAIIVVVLLDAPFLKAKIDERKFAKEQDVLENSKIKKENRKVIFCDTKDLANEYISQRIKESKPVSKEELLEIEQAIKDKPYILANQDGTKIGDYEAIKAERLDETVDSLLRENDGMIIFEWGVRWK